MRKTANMNLSRVAVISGATALAFGLGAPGALAEAHRPPGQHPGNHQGAHHAPGQHPSKHAPGQQDRGSSWDDGRDDEATDSSQLTLAAAAASEDEPIEQSEPEPTAPVDGTDEASFTEVQEETLAFIDNKLAQIDRAEQRITGNGQLSDEHEAALLERLQTMESTLTGLRADVSAASTVEQVEDALEAAKDTLGSGFGFSFGQFKS